MGEEKKCREEGSVTPTTDSAMSSDVHDVQSAQSLCRRRSSGEDGVQQQGSEEERKREERVLSFYTGICPCAVRAVRAVCASRLDKSSLAGPCASPCASTFVQVVVSVFSEARKRRQRQCRDKTSS